MTLSAILQDIGLVTAAAFSAGGDLLAAATSSCRLVVWDVAPASLSRWSQQNMQHPPEALLSLPGIPSHISFSTDPQVCPGIPFHTFSSQEALLLLPGIPSPISFSLDPQVWPNIPTNILFKLKMH